MAIRYPVGRYLHQMSVILGLPPERVLLRCGYSESLIDLESFSVNAEMFFKLWNAMIEEEDRPGVELDLAIAYANSSFVPQIIAFSCADTVELGLSRLSEFKPSVGPLTIELTRKEDRLLLEMHASENGLSIPPSLGLFELIYTIQCTRNFTGTSIIPLEMSLPGYLEISDPCLDFLGSTPKTSNIVSMVLSADDAERPLISRSPALWGMLEPNLLEKLEQNQDKVSMTSRVKKVIAEALPSGSISVDDIAKQLNISKRSLQRKLKEESTCFQELLNETRVELAKRYLKTKGLSVQEISYLLGFQDCSSFFRAFNGWTGVTPGDYRANDMPISKKAN